MDSAAWLNAYRVFPRAFSLFYLYCTYSVTQWFVLLPDPSTEQAAFASAFVATAAAWFKFYVETGTK